MSRPTRHEWQRYWLPLGETLNLDEGGFLPDPEDAFRTHYNPRIRTLESLRGQPLLVLLGEPGAGKSTVLEEAAAQLGKAGHLVHYKRLNEFTEADLVPEVFGADTVRSWRSGSSRLHLLLDSLDECRLTIPVAANLLLRELRKLPTERLSLHITCRTADWPPGYTDELRALWPASSTQNETNPADHEDGEGDHDAPTPSVEYELVLLRRRDVEQAARDCGIDAAAFLQRIRDLDIQPFATQPNTLRMLLSVYAKDGQLPDTKAAIFHQGCALLATESSKSRLRSGFRGELDVSQRLAVAGRMATMMMLGDRHAVWLGTGMEHDQGDLSPVDLFGSDEQVGQLRFPVDGKALGDVLNTSLFTARGAHRMGFGHQSWAEYLAADYLVSRIQDTGRLLTLLRWGDDGRVPPRLAELAAWVASLSPAAFDALAETDPDLLLRADILNIQTERKARLVEGLLRASLLNQASLWHWENRRHFQKLAYAGLAGQLRPWIADRTLAESVRVVALEIALACKLNELAELAADIALDTGEQLRIRASAALLAAESSDAATLRRMRPLALGTNAAEDEIRSYILPRLWPEHISTREIFDICLTAHSWRYLGHYRYYPEEFIARFQLDDLLIALGWLEDTERSHVDFEGDRLADAVMARAWEESDKPLVLEAFARVVESLHRRYERVFNRHGERMDDPHPFTTDARKRRALIRSVLSLLGDPERQAVALIFGDEALIQDEDMPWLLGQYSEEADAGQHYRLAQCLRLLFQKSARTDWMDSLFDAACRDAPNDNSPLADALAPYIEPIWLGSEAHAQACELMQRQWELEQRRSGRKPLVPPPAVRVRDALAEFTNGKHDTWMRLWQELSLPDDAVGYQSSLVPILKSPGWLRASTEERERILDCASAWAMENRLREQDIHRPHGQVSYLHVATWLALELLLGKRPAVLKQAGQVHWSNWLPAVVAYPYSSGDQTRAELIRMGYKLLPDISLEEIWRKLDKEIGDKQTYFQGLKDLTAISSSEAAEGAKAYLGKLTDRKQRLAFLTHLVKQKDEESIKLSAQDFVATAEAGESEWPASYELAAMLLEHVPSQAWPTVWEKTLADSAYGEALWLHLAGKSGFLTVLDEVQLGEYYVWLEGHFTAASDPPHPVGDVFSSTPRDEVASLRNACIAQLSSKGTDMAVQVLEGLAARFPEFQWLFGSVIRAKEVRREKSWSGVIPATLKYFLERSDARIVRNEAELAEAVKASLSRLQTLLQGATPLVPFLWNVEEKESSGRPKSEDRLSDFVAQHLRGDLRRMVIDREPLVRNKRETGIGERTDIKVEVPADDGSPIVVVVETKGCWNPELFKSMGPQLKDRYLRLFGAHHGIYLVGWFGGDFWLDGPKKRVCLNYGNGLDVLRERLEEQARRLSDGDCAISVVVLDCHHPVPSS